MTKTKRYLYRLLLPNGKHPLFSHPFGSRSIMYSENVSEK